MRPLLHPALPRFWRAPDTLQIGAEPATGVIVAGLDRAAIRLLPALDGTRSLTQLRELAEDYAAAPQVADRVVEAFLNAGVLLDAEQLIRVPPMLQPELAALVRPSRSLGGVSVVLRQRRAAHVQLLGAGRVGAAVATLLAASGVGTLVVHDPSTATPDQLMPGGLIADDVGRRCDRAVVAAVGRLNLETSTAPSAANPRPQLVVLAPPSGLARFEAAALMRSGIPHLLARASETTAAIGPFVVPGQTSCLRCHDLHRADRDPAWPRIVIQASAPRAVTPASTVATAAIAAAVAVADVLAYLDGHVPETWNATLEAVYPSPLLRRRSWAPHPACGCFWDVAASGAPTGDSREQVTMGA